MLPHGPGIGLGFLLGSLARVSMLRSDYRQYPTYPHSYASHLFLGMIAALAGAVTVPALLEKEWTSVTFFLLVAQQFREIRSMERDSLKAMEDNELVTRGSDYIENIARVFEARYYVVIFVAASASGGFIMGSVWTGLLFGGIAFALGALVMGRERLGDLSVVEEAPLRFDEQNLYVGDVFIINVGLQESRETILQWGLGAMLSPKDDLARDTLASPGQRQAMLHDAAVVLGVRLDRDNPEFSPQAARDLETGKVAIYMMPMEKDQEALIQVLERTPVLESARGTSLRAKAGRKARD